MVLRVHSQEGLLKINSENSFLAVCPQLVARREEMQTSLVLLSERSQTLSATYGLFCLYELFRVGRSKETERLVAARGGQGGWKRLRSCCTLSKGLPFGVTKMS